MCNRHKVMVNLKNAKPRSFLKKSKRERATIICCHFFINKDIMNKNKIFIMEILTDANFEEFISKSDKPVLLDVFATWCPPCKMLGPVLEKLGEDYKDKV